METKNIKQEIKEHFLKHPTEKLRVREIERKLQLPLPSVIRYCKELETEGTLTIFQIGNASFYTADKTNENYILEKKLFNLKSIFRSGLVNHLKQELSNPNVILFGSFSKGEDIEESDIDLYVETSSSKNVNLEKFEKILDKKIQLIKSKSLKQIKNKALANNIINGINLNGQVEVFK